MQLNKIVNFHKVMGDATRIRICILLSHGPKHNAALAGMLGLRPPTISHHLAKLKEANIIHEKREKNTIYYHFNAKDFEQYSMALPNKLNGGEKKSMPKDQLTEQQAILQNFLTKEGKLKNIPSQRKKKLIVLYHLAKGLEMGRKYPEKELNEYIKQYHEDFATLRREFIINSVMDRHESVYELNPPEMWAAIE
jgi:hypothetical protein